MMSEISYIPYGEAIEVYRKMVRVSGGGLSGVRDAGGIQSVLDFIRHDGYYPTFEDKLTHLVYGLCRGHFFSDGNKRIAIALGAYFLLRNGYIFQAEMFMPRMEAIIYHVADSRIDKELLSELIVCIIGGVDYSENLKLRLADAIAGVPHINSQEDN